MSALGIFFQGHQQDTPLKPGKEGEDVIVVKTYYNTMADGSPVPEDVDMEDMPITFHGPFESETQAVSFMENDWPDGDTDIYEQIVTSIPAGSAYVNTPESIHGDIPDEDIRDV